jgi:hypothetical protein
VLNGNEAVGGRQPVGRRRCGEGSESGGWMGGKVASCDLANHDGGLAKPKLDGGELMASRPSVMVRARPEGSADGGADARNRTADDAGKNGV